MKKNQKALLERWRNMKGASASANIDSENAVSANEGAVLTIPQTT